ncbi:MAG: hypothetical protein P8M16_10510 [Acidimicrobiales bacterium]|nr:hypothetical protein [Acidimicrobiales bacterium]
MGDPDIDNSELETLESDLAIIAVAMDQADSGDLEGAETSMGRLNADPAFESA